MLTLKQILAQIHPGDWFASVDLKDAYFHIQIAPHHRRFSEVCCQLSRKSTAFQYSILPSGLLWPHALSKCINAALPPQIEWKAHPQLSGRLADFSSVPGYAYQPHRQTKTNIDIKQKLCNACSLHVVLVIIIMISKQAYHSAENPTYLSCNRGATILKWCLSARDRSDEVVR